MRGTVLAGTIAALLALPQGAGAGGSFTLTTYAGVFQGDGVQIRVSKSSNGLYLGDVEADATIQGCPAPRGHTVWIVDPETAGKSAKVYAADCSDGFSTAKFTFSGGYVRVCTAEPGSTQTPTSSAAIGTLPGTVGAPGCADLKQISQGEPAGQTHTAGDYVKKIRRGRCVLKYGPTSFFTKIATVPDDPAVRVLMSVNGHSAEIGQKSGSEYRFDLKARKGANVVKVTVKTFHGKKYVKKKTLYC